MMHRFHSIAMSLVAAGLMAMPASMLAQSGPPAPPAAPGSSMTANSSAPANENDHLLMPGDLIAVTVFQEPDLYSTLRLARDGSVVFPLIGRISIGGMTPQAAQKLIRDLLDKDYLVNPQVSLLVTEYAARSFTVLGEVQKPGRYDMPDRASVSLLEAIGMSGGYTRVANPGNVTVKRKVGTQETIFKLNAKKMAASGDLSAFEIQPDDVITVTESMF
jgi:protein involved in polysaccharide export with SLBB domain